MPEVDRREVPDLKADLYLAPGRRSPGIVLVLGALREGRRYPLLETTARHIAGCGCAVLVPELGRLRQLILGPDALDDLVAAALALPGQEGVVDAPVGLIGFSLGGSLALLAAGDGRLRGHIACVASMGAYFRLTGMLTAATIGTLAAPSAYAVAASLVATLPDADRRALEAVLDVGRDSPLEALARVDPASVGSPARAVLSLFTNRDPDAIATLLQRVEGAGTLAGLSPEDTIGQIEAPVWVLHDERDRYVPFSEFRLLREVAAERRNFTFLSTRLLEHTEPLPPALNPIRLVGDYLPGLMRLARFVRGPLAAVRRRARSG